MVEAAKPVIWTKPEDIPFDVKKDLPKVAGWLGGRVGGRVSVLEALDTKGLEFDGIVVVDSGSVDDTVAIAKRFTDRVVVRGWEGYAAQKNVAASLAIPGRDRVGGMDFLACPTRL